MLMVLHPFLGRLVGVSFTHVASPVKKRICNLLCSDRHNPDVTQRKYPRKCSQIVVSKMLYGTDTHPNMAESGSEIVKGPLCNFFSQNYIKYAG